MYEITAASSVACGGDQRQTFPNCHSTRGAEQESCVESGQFMEKLYHAVAGSERTRLNGLRDPFLS